jgi:hypothetical protein
MPGREDPINFAKLDECAGSRIPICLLRWREPGDAPRAP